MLWVETAHFKLGSSLRTYSRSPDADERARLADELELLEPRLPGKRPRRSDLDPWLRLHLYALRLEALHAAFMERLGLSDADCVPLETDTWAQVWEKPVVLLTERTSTLGRFTETFLGRSCSSSYRGILENGGSFYGISAQSLREDDLPLDLALHVFVAEAVTLCLVDSFRRNLGSVPLWFKYGLGHVLARDIDPRWPRFEGHSERRESLSNAWKWEPRVEGMLRKGSAPSFEAMLAWEDPLRMTRVEHLFAWSRSEWLLQREGAARSFLIEVVHEARSSPGAPPQPAQVERQRALIEDAWGAELGELDRQWSEYVKKSY